MIIDLDHQGLIHLVKGTEPPYALFSHPLVKKCGHFTGGFVDEWSWNSHLNTLSEEELYELYKLCREEK